MRQAENVGIKTVSLCKSFFLGDREILALKDVSMEIDVGDFITISGPSGAGKTTLLNMISGLDRPTRGDIIVLDTRLNELVEDELADFRCINIGFVFQDYNLISTLSTRENIEFARQLAGFNRVDFESTTMTLLDMVGLTDRANHLPDQLSGGERQRLAFARALTNEPPIFLADEPTGNLDDENALGILDILQKLKKDGKTIVVVTHDERIRKVADRRFRMNRGVVVEKW